MTDMDPIFTKMIPCLGVGILEMIPCSAARPRTEKYIEYPTDFQFPVLSHLGITSTYDIEQRLAHCPARSECSLGYAGANT